MRVGGGGSFEGDWFAQRFTRARTLIPDAEFDTIVPAEFAETITCELVDVTGVASASPVDFYSGGVVVVDIGDAVISPSHARLQLTGSSSHVGSLAGRSWYMASLVRAIRPDDDEIGNTTVEAIGLWGDDDNRVGLGIYGAVSGGSVTNWVGFTSVGGSTNTSIGPALDPEESPVWHLFEAWFDVDAGTVSFAIDGVTFDDTLATADLPSMPARLSMISDRFTAADPSATNYDKACVVVASPRVGEAD